MIKLLIFDYDGVLFDTKKVAYNLVKKACSRFCDFKIRNEHDFIEIYKSNFYEAMLKRGVKRKDLDRISSFSVKELGKKRLQIHSGIKSAVKKLSKTHILAVVSSNYDDVMAKNLERSGILSDFDYIFGTEEGESKKAKIKMLLKQSNTKKSEALFITDTVGDIREAKMAGIKVMAVSWGFHKKPMLKKAKPDYLAESSKSILEALA